MSGPEQWPDEGPGGFEDSGGTGIPPFLLDPWGILQRRWPWMLVTLALGVAAAVGVTSTWKHRYAAEAKVAINSQQIPKEFVRSTVAESSTAYLNSAVSKVLSLENLSRIIEEVGLYEQSSGEVSRESLVGRMRSAITVEPKQIGSSKRGPVSFIYGLGFESDDPEDAASVANALAGLLQKVTLEQRSEQARSVTRFLRQALEQDERELRAHTQEMADFRVAHRGTLPSDLKTGLPKLDLLHQRREELAAEIALSQSQLQGVGAGPVARPQTENELLLEELRRKLAGQLAGHTDDHPNVIALRRQVQSFEEIVAQELGGGGPGGSPVLAAEQRALELRRSRLRALDAEIDALSEQVDQMPLVSEKLSALEQKETILREDYLNSLRKVEDAELAETLEVAQRGAQIEILETARPPGAPLLSRWLVLAAGVALSLGLGLVVGVLFELLDPILLVASQIEAIVEKPVLGSLPRVAP